jgi:hypothetical protein
VSAVASSKLAGHAAGFGGVHGPGSSAKKRKLPSGFKAHSAKVVQRPNASPPYSHSSGAGCGLHRSPFEGVVAGQRGSRSGVVSPVFGVGAPASLGLRIIFVAAETYSSTTV